MLIGNQVSLRALEHASALVRNGLDWVLDLPGGRDVLEFVAAPGLFFPEYFGLSVGNGAPLMAATLAGWYLWVRTARTLYFVIARPLGLASPAQYHEWTRLWLPWHKPYRKWIEVRRFFRQLTFNRGPSQYWAGFWERAAYPFNRNRGDLLVGRLPLFERFGLHMPVGLPDGKKHLAVLSYSGGGKTAWLHTVIGCMPKEQSAFIFDVDGAMYNALADHLRREGHRVVRFDVDKLTDGTDQFNPINELTVAAERHGNEAVYAFAKQLAEALIVPDSKHQPVFVNTARILLLGLVLWTWLVEEDKSLVRVRELLTRGMPEKTRAPGETGFSRLIFEMSNLAAPRADGTLFDDGCNGALCRAIANCCGLLQQSGQGHGSGQDAPDNFRKTAIYQTAWLDDANTMKVVGGKSDIAGEALKLTNSVVFMIATLTDTQTRLAPLVRSFVALSLYAFQRTLPALKPKFPSTFYLDEFPNLGRLDAVALAMPGFRKYGVRVVTLSQSILLLANAYGETHREFLNQSDATLWMGIAPTDSATLSYLSKDVLGECLRKEKVDGYHWLVRGLLRPFGVKLPPARYQRVPRRLMTEQQCAAFLDQSTGQMLVTREGKAPMRLKRLVHWNELGVTQYVNHPGEKESYPRSLTRRLIALAAQRKQQVS